MQNQNHIEIIESLANGIDPITGEIFPSDSSFQQVEVVRALFAAKNALEKVERYD